MPSYSILALVSSTFAVQQICSELCYTMRYGCAAMVQARRPMFLRIAKNVPAIIVATRKSVEALGLLSYHSRRRFSCKCCCHLQAWFQICMQPFPRIYLHAKTCNTFRKPANLLNLNLSPRILEFPHKAAAPQAA